MIDIIFKLSALTAIIFLASCGNSNRTIPDSIAPEDSSAYNIGRNNARILLEKCTTETDIRRELLDMRARETNIRSRVGPKAADAYILGIKSYLIESGDTLASTLFP